MTLVLVGKCLFLGANKGQMGSRDIYIYIWWPPPPKTYVFYKHTAIYSVSRTFWPLDFGSFFGGHHVYNINKIHDM